MVAMVRQGHSVREVARKFGVSPPTVQRWVDRADGTRLDRAGFQDLSSAPKKVANRVAPEVESKVLILRAHLRDHSALGEFGAAAIRRQMQALGEADIPSLRTISYILERGGALDYRRRVRRPPPPKGWYLPDVAGRLHEMDQFDFVEGLVIESGINVEVLNAISLHGGLCQSWPGSGYTTELALEPSFNIGASGGCLTMRSSTTTEDLWLAPTRQYYWTGNQDVSGAEYSVSLKLKDKADATCAAHLQS